MVSPDNVVNDFHNTFLSYYFHPLITKPTRVFKYKSSLLDNIYTNFSNIAVSGILKTEFSDHYSLFCITKEAKKNDSKVSHIKREFAEENISNFNPIRSGLFQTVNDPGGGGFKSRFQGHLSYFHSIVAKLCSTDHQSCQEPETLSVGHFFKKSC